MTETVTLEKPIKNITSFQKTEIIDKLAQEIPQREIASQYGVHQPNISQINIKEKEKIKERKLQLQELAPNILEEFKYDCLTSVELSKHLYRPLEYPNETALQNNQEITTHKNGLARQKIKILENIGIFTPQTLLNITQYNQDNRQINIEPKIMKLFSGSLADNMQTIDMNEVSTIEENSDNVDNS